MLLRQEDEGSLGVELITVENVCCENPESPSISLWVPPLMIKKTLPGNLSFIDRMLNGCFIQSRGVEIAFRI